ncbi:MAG: hypothetical protein LBF69_03520 [Prevotellaceae bacterium]|nr:hypothetical protein [Prevotellaceae bacterium]
MTVTIKLLKSGGQATPEHPVSSPVRCAIRRKIDSNNRIIDANKWIIVVNNCVIDANKWSINSINQLKIK